ncbi:MAG: alpha/beta hydrolase [Parvularculales bacterium]
MAFPESRFVESNGLRMAVYEQGNGLPVIFCHGFPELAYSWRHQLPALSNAGYRAIAPDQRGYGATGGPREEAAVPDYDIVHLTDDMVGLMDALALDKAIFCGHDWGGFIVWQMPLLHPDRVAGVIGVNTPFTPRAPADPIAIMRERMGDDMYIVYFQKYGDAEALLEEDIPKSMRFWYRKNTITRKIYDTLPEENKRLALLEAFKQPESEWGGEPLLTDEEMAYYVTAFEKTGYTGGINWYRNFTRNWEMSAGLKEKINVPCLMISAADDIVLQPEMTEGMENYISDLEKHIIPDCGHWTQQEKPDDLNALIIDWLNRRFGGHHGT